MGIITYFGVGSALLVLDRMAMLEPRYVGRVTERLPRFFVYSLLQYAYISQSRI